MLFISTQPLLPIPSSWPKYKCHQFITSNLCGLSFIITIWEEGELPIFELRIDENMSILRSSYSNLDVKKVEHSHCHLLWVCLSIIIYFYILKTSELTTIIYQKVRNFEKGVKKKGFHSKLVILWSPWRFHYCGYLSPYWCNTYWICFALF